MMRSSHDSHVTDERMTTDVSSMSPDRSQNDDCYPSVHLTRQTRHDHVQRYVRCYISADESALTNQLLPTVFLRNTKQFSCLNSICKSYVKQRFLCLRWRQRHSIVTVDARLFRLALSPAPSDCFCAPYISAFTLHYITYIPLSAIFFAGFFSVETRTIDRMRRTVSIRGQFVENLT